ncbi:MAG: ATPase [Robiginitomaculum sp.]|nr:MAG: ATPase [Robiginitomaculum sp.]
MAKRFYKEVGVEARDGAFVVVLDGRVLKTPGKQHLTFDKEFRAALVAQEWDAQEGDIKPETMPCTRMMNVACEQTPDRRPDLVAEFRKYCGTDLLCYRSHAPRDLCEQQERDWQPILDWAVENHNIALAVTTSIHAVGQAETSLNAAAAYAQTLSHTKLTLLVHFTASLGSSILALALLEGRLNLDESLALSRLDEEFQIERWGEDEEAQERIQNLHTELAAMARLITA